MSFDPGDELSIPLQSGILNVREVRITCREETALAVSKIESSAPFLRGRIVDYPPAPASASPRQSVLTLAVVVASNAPAQAFSETLMRTGLVDNVASDAHDTGPRRAPGITPVLEEAGFGAQADWLSRGVPPAVLNGSRIPPRPQPESRGGRAVLGLIGERKVTWR